METIIDGYNWFFRTVINDSFAVYDLVCLSMLFSCAVYYKSKSTFLALGCYTIIIALGMFDWFLSLHLMIQKAAYATPFILASLFVKRKTVGAFLPFIGVQIVYMGENLLYGQAQTSITSLYPVLSFLSVIFMTARFDFGDSYGGCFTARFVNLCIDFYQANFSHNNQSH